LLGPSPLNSATSNISITLATTHTHLEAANLVLQKPQEETVPTVNQKQNASSKKFSIKSFLPSWFASSTSKKHKYALLPAEEKLHQD
jgi:hypothetical protein